MERPLRESGWPEVSDSPTVRLQIPDKISPTSTVAAFLSRSSRFFSLTAVLLEPCIPLACKAGQRHPARLPHSPQALSRSPAAREHGSESGVSRLTRCAYPTRLRLSAIHPLPKIRRIDGDSPAADPSGFSSVSFRPKGRK